MIVDGFDELGHELTELGQDVANLARHAEGVEDTEEATDATLVEAAAAIGP
jgi:hypothetical protein